MIEENILKTLKQRIPDELFQMSEHLKDIDAYRATLSFRLVRERKKLIEEEKRFQMIKSPRVTELDRKLYTEFNTRDQREIVSELETAIMLIKDRTSIIQSLLKIETEAYKRT